MRKSGNEFRKGSMMLYSAVALPVLFAFIALAVDFGYISNAKAELRAAVDAANLAGSAGLATSPAEARKLAKEIAAANTVGGQPLILTDSDIQLGSWNASTRTFTVLSSANESQATAIRINAQLTQAKGNPVNLIFGRFIGFSTKDLVSSGVAGAAQGSNVVIVQDITSSFSDELTEAKAGDIELLKSIWSNGTSLSRVGIVVHTGWGKTLANIQPVSANYVSLTNTLNSIKLCGNSQMPACSGTDIAAGLEEGTKVFDNAGTLSGSKVIVLVSDGEPTSSKSGSHSALNDTQLLTLAQQRASEAWAKGIHIYVVFYNRDNSTSAANAVKTLARGKGDFVQVTNAADLPVKLKQVFARLPAQLLN
jgi:Flp pilus assembly protein TadG